jgi:hypothetical protein
VLPGGFFWEENVNNFTRLMIPLLIVVFQIFQPMLGQSELLAAETLRPFLSGSAPAGNYETAIVGIRDTLPAAGFEIVGEYEPYPGAHIFATSNAVLRENATNSKKGGFGSVLRFALTEIDGELQYSVVNPVWMANSYRLKNDLSELNQALSQLGLSKQYGCEDGKSAKELRKYHYMMMMPYFDDLLKLAEFDTQQDAVSTVIDNLSRKTAGCDLVYRIDLANGDVLVGVGISKDKGADKAVMETVDQADLRHTAHLPYELLISDGIAYALHAKFRIANSFPDLTMGTFMKIVAAPGAIESSLKAVCGK